MQIAVIQQRIHEIRGQKVMLDFDLAELYAVETKVLNQAIKRNIDRFPTDFMFRLKKKEWDFIRSQFATSSNNPGNWSQIVTSSTDPRNSSQIVTSSRKHRGLV